MRRTALAIVVVASAFSAGMLPAAASPEPAGCETRPVRDSVGHAGGAASCDPQAPGDEVRVTVMCQPPFGLPTKEVGPWVKQDGVTESTVLCPLRNFAYDVTADVR